MVGNETVSRFITLEIEFLPYHTVIVFEVRRCDGEAFVCFEPSPEILTDTYGATILGLGYIGFNLDFSSGEVDKLRFPVGNLRQLPLVNKEIN